MQTGKVLLAFRQFPLGNPLSQGAAEAAECADRQGKFWEYHDALFQASESFDPPGLITRARVIGLTEEAFTTCLDGQTRAQVLEDSASGMALQVSGTPTFFVGTIDTDRRVKVSKRFSGAPPLAAFEAVLAGLIEDTKQR
jgi:protein-disulfide isomerase